MSSRSSSGDTLQEIEHDLATVESGLNNRSRGRAFFDSLNSMLGSLRQRLDRSQSNGDFHHALSERLGNAEFAQSNRIPLRLVQNQESMTRRTAEQMNAFREASNSSIARDDEREKSNHSSLVASRRRLSHIETVHEGLHTSSQALLSPVAESSATDAGETEPMDIDDTNEDCLTADRDKKEHPLLLPQASLKGVSSLSRNVSGSLNIPDDVDMEVQCALFSWGSPLSFHDDDSLRTAEQSLVSKEDRIGHIAEIVSVACGPSHIACVTKQGGVYTCGDNRAGAVDPCQREYLLSVRPSLLEQLASTTVIQVSCGWDHTAAVTSTGAVLAWGDNSEGQLGRKLSASFNTPKTIPLGPETRAAAVACGNHYTLVLTTRMSMLICGREELAGSNDRPKQLPALVGLPIASISAGRDHAIVLTVHGTAYAWGVNNKGCCGRQFPKSASSPLPMVPPESRFETLLGDVSIPKLVHEGSTIHVADDARVVHAACGDDFSILVTAAGCLLVCGSNDKGQLGIPKDTKETSRLESVQHPISGQKFVSVEAGSKFAILLDDAGDVWQTEHGSLECVLKGRRILTIAAGGNQRVALSHGNGSHLQFELVHDFGSSEITHSVESLTSRIRDELTEEDSISASGKELVNRLEGLLKYPSVLNSLFLDPDELNHLYNEIYAVGGPKLKQALKMATETGIQRGIESLQAAGARMIYPASVRCFLHYIRFFEDDSQFPFDPLGSTIAALCESILSLPFEGFKNLLAWISLYPSKLFVAMLVKPLLSQLEKALKVEVDENGVEHQKVARRAAPVIVAVLSWLHHVSERMNLAKADDFYSRAVSQIPLETLFEDLYTKKLHEKLHTSNRFLVSQYPFIIPPATKRDLLQMESNVTMLKTAAEDGTRNLAEGTISIDPFFVVEVARKHLLEHTFKAIADAKPKDLRKKLRIKFEGEEGIDAGGVAKEFFQLVSEELFDVSSSLWTKRFGEDITWINSDCTWDDEGFERAGQIVGLAIYNSVLLDVRFPNAFYRKLLDKPLGLEDVVDKDLRRGLQQLLDYEDEDVECVFCLTFDVTSLDLGKEQKIELKPGGANIPVTNDNKEEYVVLYVKWLLVDSIDRQYRAFKKGFDQITEGISLDIFTPEELEMLVIGSPQLDFAALEANAEYEGGYDTDSPVVKHLWTFIKNADQETQMNFLKFATGSSMAPIGGLGALDFKVQRAGPDSSQLPTSHTCFNTILLPDYGDQPEKLKERLSRAIVECEGFGLQ